MSDFKAKKHQIRIPQGLLTRPNWGKGKKKGKGEEGEGGLEGNGGREGPMKSVKPSFSAPVKEYRN